MRPFAFLVLAEHPYGRQMLARLLAAELVPDVIVEEHSDDARLEHDKFVERMAGHPLAPGLDALLAGRAVRRERVPDHNDPACVALLADLAPSLTVLGGTRILRRRVLGVAGTVLNAHPGLLPEVRGSASVAWAVERDLPVGCTVHLVDPGVDTGPIVARQALPVPRGATYEDLCHGTCLLSAELMAGAVAQLRDGRLRPRPQTGEGTTHRNMPPEGVARVKARLAAGEYSHYAD